MHLALRQHDPRPRRVLDCKLGLAVLPRDPPDRARQVVPVQARLDVADRERLDVQVVQAQQRDGVVDVEAEAEGAQEVFALLERGGAVGGGGGGVARGAQFDGFGGEVHAHLELEMFHQGWVDF